MMDSLKEELSEIETEYYYFLRVYQKMDVSHIDGLIKDMTELRERYNKVAKRLKDMEEWNNYDK